MWVVLTASAWAQQATVESTGVPYPTLQQAVDAAAPGDTITISAALAGNTVTIADALTLPGAGSYASPATAIETIAGTTLVIEDLAISAVAGTGIDSGGSLELRDSEVTGNADFGGGIRMGGPSLVAERVTFTDATA